MRILTVLLFSLLYVSLSFSALADPCPAGKSSILVPAVVNDGGDLLVVEAITLPGDGDIYATVFPAVGLATQDSIRTALEYAFEKAGYDQSHCDVFIKIDNKHTSLIDGPSAGVAISVVTYSALVDKPVRQDSTITGAVNSLGRAFPVGGVFEKSYAAATAGVSYILTPPHSFDEEIILDSFSPSDITFIEFTSVDEAIAFLIENKTLPQEEFSTPIREIPDIVPHEDAGLEPFNVVASAMIEVETEAMKELPDFLEKSRELKTYYQNEIIRQNYLVSRGYPYTAANEAFQNVITLNTIVNLYSLNEKSLESQTADARNCIESLPGSPLYPDSFEWVTGAQQRKSWALQKLVTLKDENATLVEEKYFYLRELGYVSGWCIVANSLLDASVSDTSLQPIDESVFSIRVDRMIDEVGALPLSSSWSDYVESARISHNRNHEVAALYDLNFAKTMDQVDKDLASLNASDLAKTSSLLSEYVPRSLWAKVYFSQGMFLYNQDDMGGSYRMFTYAQTLDALHDSIIFDAAMHEPPLNESPSQPTDLSETQSSMPCLALMLLISVVITLWKH